MRYLAATLLACLALAAQAQAPKSVRVLDWLLPVPAGWTPQVSSSTMRVAQFTAGSKLGAADIAVFHFGLAGGGTVQENIDRWASQFLDGAGKPVKPAVEKGSASGMPVTWVALDGRYARGVGTGPQGPGAANQSLRVAVLETPAGNLFFQLWGDRAAVTAQERAFRGAVSGLRRGP